MKKYLNILLSLLLIFSLSSCFWNSKNEDVEDVKKELLDDSVKNNDNEEDIPKYEDENNEDDKNLEEDSEKDDKKDDSEKNIEKESYTVRYLWNDQFLEIDNLDKQDFTNRNVVITGTTLVNVDKIIVNFSNSESKFPNDKFQLTKFKAGDKNFTYNAFSKYEVLDYWRNEYIIEAYFWDEVAKLEIIINIPTKEEKKITKTEESEKKTDKTNIDSKLDSDIDWLKLWVAEENLDVSDSDWVTDFLTKYTPNNAWFYWNSSKPLNSGEWLSVYVLRIDWTWYIYEKYYYTPDWSLWVLQLEKWTWVDRDNISEKNSELKERNSDFDTSEVDKYFKDKLKN